MARPLYSLVSSSILAVTLCAGSARAAPLPARPVLTLEAARTVAAAAEGRAGAEGWPCVVEVVDSGGLPILLERMDYAALEDAIDGSWPAALSARGFVLMRGDLPSAANGQIVGAVGVSADTPNHDEVIPKAGIAELVP